MATLSDHGSEVGTLANLKVWRVNWNLTGTILASSGDDSRIRLWKQDMNREWKALSTLTDDGGD